MMTDKTTQLTHNQSVITEMMKNENPHHFPSFCIFPFVPDLKSAVLTPNS